MRPHSAFLFVILLAAVSGCAHKQKIIIDPVGVNMGQFEQDQQACEQLASQINKGESAARESLGSAIIGGLVGAALGDRRSAQRLAGAGAVFGLAGGANSAQNEQNLVVRNCLRHRGYTVLN